MKKKNKYGLYPEEHEKLFNVWRNMICRCYDVNSERYYAYGARGITVCDEWKKDFHCFVKFAVSNGWRTGLSIERKDVNKGYSPSNCIFITMKEQARNKTNNVFLEYNGETKCVIEWCELLGLKPKTIYKRIYDGHTDVNKILFKGDLRHYA